MNATHRTPRLPASFVALSVALAISICAARALAEPAKDRSIDVSALKAKADAGDANAQIALGVDYRDGDGVARDNAQALAWFRKAADENEPAAFDHLGWMYEHGLGVAADIATAAAYYRRAAEKGVAQGQWNLGRVYAETSWGKFDVVAAARWYRRAAAAGHREAQYRLGIAYLQGEGVSPDDAAALEWFRKSAEHGNEAAALALGTMYALGRGVAHGDDEARRWFTKAIRPGDRFAADAIEWLELRKKPAIAGQFACLKVPHISQAWNMCGVASATMALAFDGATHDQHQVKRLCGSPVGEGTDWLDIVSAAGKMQRHWDLVTFSDDRAGLDAGRKRMMAWLDTGHPILLDITLMYHGEPAGHTITIIGYTDAGRRWVINNPALGPPGIEIYDTAKLETLWHSRWYSSKSTGISRPIILTR